MNRLVRWGCPREGCELRTYCSITSSRMMSTDMHTLWQTVKAMFNYTKPLPAGEELYQYVYKLPDGSAPNNWEVDPHEMTVHDLKTAQTHFSLQKNGFQLETLRVDEDIDWADDADIRSRYYPAVQQLIQQVSSASRVYIFDHTLRKGTLRDGPGSGQSRTPVSKVHVDYNTVSGPDRLRAVMPPDEAAALSKRPFAVIQVWRPIKGPIQESPLGMIDASTVDKQDYIDLRLQFESRTGFNYALKHNPAHQWYYAKGMDTDEAYVFKCYDSRSGRVRFTPHSGFEDPTTPAGAPPRESIEIRAYAFWEHEAEQPIAREL
ncbi:hypothetical protein WJX73_003589 [Symbiochloris irregularis]|uniref:Methyltransferase n=1 Tax=Symbiochloris irregularis TaxID=706552 RepID=A0AAW1NWG2_9CHLO